MIEVHVTMLRYLVSVLVGGCFSFACLEAGTKIYPTYFIEIALSKFSIHVYAPGYLLHEGCRCLRLSS